MKYWVPDEHGGLKLIVIHWWRDPRRWWKEMWSFNAVNLTTTYAGHRAECEALKATPQPTDSKPEGAGGGVR